MTVTSQAARCGMTYFQTGRAARHLAGRTCSMVSCQVKHAAQYAARRNVPHGILLAATRSRPRPEAAACARASDEPFGVLERLHVEAQLERVVPVRYEGTLSRLRRA
eukprot:6106616-Pleurochrysis_carterae.AAC.5